MPSHFWKWISFTSRLVLIITPVLASAFCLWCYHFVFPVLVLSFSLFNIFTILIIIHNFIFFIKLLCICLRSHILNRPFQDIRDYMKSLMQKEARKKKFVTRNNKRVGMWSFQSRKTIRGCRHCQGEVLPMENWK